MRNPCITIATSLLEGDPPQNLDLQQPQGLDLLHRDPAQGNILAATAMPSPAAMAECAAPETPGHLGPMQLDGRNIFSQRLVESVFDATGVRVYYRTRKV